VRCTDAQLQGFDPSWRSFAAVQGGLVAGHMLQAAADVVAGAPRTFTTHFLGPVTPGAPVSTHVLHDRTAGTSSYRVEMRQGGTLVAVAQGLSVRPRSGPDPAPAQTYPGPGAAADLADVQGTPGAGQPFVPPVDVVPVSQHLEMRMLDDRRPASGGEPELNAWVRVRPASVRWTPLVQLCLLADALPPSAFVLLPEPVGLPTVELTVHLARTPPAAGSWTRIRQRMTWLDDEVAVDDAVLHDERGRLTAVVRQTRRTAGHRLVGVLPVRAERVRTDDGSEA
jgi:acyl-CoA thioesterase